jgi:hypothetical protein
MLLDPKGPKYVSNPCEMNIPNMQRERVPIKHKPTGSVWAAAPESSNQALVPVTFFRQHYICRLGTSTMPPL